MRKKRKPYRQVAQSKHRMQSSLIEILREKPYNKITISEINHRANLARRTFYQHFDSKDALLLSVVDDVVNPFFSELADRIIASPLFSEDSETAFITLFQQWKENDEILKLIRQSCSDMHILMKLKESFFKMYKEAVQPKEKFPNIVFGEFTVSYLAGATFMILTKWADEGMSQPPEIMGKFLFSLIGPPSIKNASLRFTEKIF